MKGEDDTIIWYSSEDSRSCDSAYTTKMKFAYADNEVGDPIYANNGFHIQPLDPALYGSRAARDSRARKAKKKGLTLNVSSRNHVGGVNNHHSSGLPGSKTGNVRTPLKIPELKLKGGDSQGPFTVTNKGVAVDSQAQEAIRQH
jgi:hypothetical protein